MSARILFLGSTVIDVTIHVDHLPSLEEDVNVISQSMQLGGCAHNASHIAYLLEVPYDLVSPCGTGAFGKMVCEKLAAKGLKPAYMHDYDSGVCYCLVDSEGNRSFMSVHGADYDFAKAMTDNIKDIYQYIYVSGIDIEGVSGSNLIEACARLRGEICYAPGPRVGLIDASSNSKILALHPILHLNMREAISLLEQLNIELGELIAKQLYDICHNIVVITNGDKAISYTDKEGHMYTMVPKRVRAIDGTGAGDGHIGAILSYLSKGLDITSAITKANEISAKIVMTNGAILENL